MSDPTYPVNRALADVDFESAAYPYPLFSLAERDRRWSALRVAMNAEELDVIVAPQNSGHSTDYQANSRWISQCGGGGDADIAVVFPLEGDVTVVATSAKARWPTVQHWVTDVREAQRNYGRVIAERLQELRPRRIGVAGLGGGTRTPEGTILAGTLQQIRDALPQASVVDATDILAELRYVKSDEEIAFLARSRDIIELGIEAEIAHAKPGASDWSVWAEAMAAMLRGGSEMTVHFNWVSGPLTQRTLTRPSHRILQRGDLILNELEASWGGYRSQSDVPVGVGQPDPVYLELMKVQKELWYDMLERLKPGVTIGDLRQRCASYCAEVAPRSGPAAGATALLNMHGRGAGDDGPIITASAKDAKQLAVPLREHMVFVLKPGVHTANDSHNTTWGDTVVVTPRGGERLGTREHGIAIAGG